MDKEFLGDHVLSGDTFTTRDNTVGNMSGERKKKLKVMIVNDNQKLDLTAVEDHKRLVFL